MSVDYVKFMQEKRKILQHLKKVYAGEVDEEELDHSQQIVSLIPVLLASKISIEMRAFLLRQYSEIKGNIRDQNLGLLERNDFYTQAVEDIEQEDSFAAQQEASNEVMFTNLVGYLDDEDTASSIEKAAKEHEVFKNNMPDVIKSALGLDANSIVGPEDIRAAEQTDLGF